MLLSVVIPTRNRQFTALYAIESALLTGNDDMEVVVQDCSDENILSQQINQKFGPDSRIRYFFSEEKLSMTENWNKAFSNTRGEFICAIGDDDAVLPAIYEIAKWAKRKNIDMVKHTQPYNYSWPGYFSEHPNGILYKNKEIQVTGNYSMIPMDKAKLYEFCTLRDPRIYLSFANIYHCVFSRNLMESIKNDTGVFLDSTAIDAYIAVVLFKYLKAYALVNYPFTLPGASPNSNSHRFDSGKIALHFHEFDNLKFPAFLPSIYVLTTTVAESVYTACKNTHQDELIQKMDLPHMYAKIYIESKSDFGLIFKKLKQYKKRGTDYVFFFAYILNWRIRKIISDIKEGMKRLLQKLLPGYFKKLRSKYGGAETYNTGNTMGAIKIMTDQLNGCDMLLD